LEVLKLIRRSSEGMSVKVLSSKLNMSYMGVKAHCIALTTAGHLTTWRQPTAKGRPQMVYRLTEKGRQLFAESGPDLALQLLKESEGLFGATAPQKLLMMYFRSLAATYLHSLTTVDPAERVHAFVRLRDAEGRISSLREDQVREIRECHNPLASVMKQYPGVATMEESMVGEVLGSPVRRAEDEGNVLFVLS
jgi:predicted ArsR family transcriptional regulator